MCFVLERAHTDTLGYFETEFTFLKGEMLVRLFCFNRSPYVTHALMGAVPFVLQHNAASAVSKSLVNLAEYVI
jgi:hypothetical protein